MGLYGISAASNANWVYPPPPPPPPALSDSPSQAPEQSQQQAQLIMLEERKRIYLVRLAEVCTHEQAHGCRFTGPVVIEDNVDQVNFSNPTDIGGHRSVSMPAVNPLNPEQTMKDADEIYDSAMAPGSNLSAADYNTADAAMTLKSQAQHAEQQLNQQSGINQQSGKKLNIVG